MIITCVDTTGNSKRRSTPLESKVAHSFDHLWLSVCDKYIFCCPAWEDEAPHLFRGMRADSNQSEQLTELTAYSGGTHRNWISVQRNMKCKTVNCSLMWKKYTLNTCTEIDYVQYSTAKYSWLRVWSDKHFTSVYISLFFCLRWMLPSECKPNLLFYYYIIYIDR